MKTRYDLILGHTQPEPPPGCLLVDATGAPALRDPELRLPPFNWLIWSVSFLWSIWLVWFNQINKINQTNQLNETDQTTRQRFSYAGNVRRFRKCGERETHALMAGALRLFSVVGAWFILKVVQVVVGNGP